MAIYLKLSITGVISGTSTFEAIQLIQVYDSKNNLISLNNTNVIEHNYINRKTASDIDKWFVPSDGGIPYDTPNNEGIIVIKLPEAVLSINKISLKSYVNTGGGKNVSVFYSRDSISYKSLGLIVFSTINETKEVDATSTKLNKFLISSEDEYFTVAQYSESDDIIPALTGNVTALGNVIRSDENASYPAWQAFDKKAITSDHQFAWISATMMSGWIGFDFSIPIIIDRYSITGRADSVYTMSPKDWTFEGSNDGTSWTVLDTRRNVVDWNTTQTRTFLIGNKAKYKMYRINAVSNNSSNGVLIKEIKMGCSNQGTYLKNVKLNNAETAYLSHGMSKSESIGLDISFSTRIFVNPTSTTLGSGKVFKQKIDTSKIPIKKASIT